MTKFPERAKSYAHVITEDGFLANPLGVQNVEKSNVSVFVVEKISHSTKYSHKIADVSGVQTSESHKTKCILHVERTAKHSF